MTVSVIYRLALFVGCLAAVVGPTGAATGPERDRFVGTYSVSGAGVQGRRYTGAMTIRQTGQTYHVRWELEGGDGYDGVGVAVGPVLSVGWQVGESAGVAVYDFSANRVVGRWSVIGSEVVYQEELTRK